MDTLELITLKEIAQALKFSQNHVRDHILTQETFPQGIHLTKSKRNARWRKSDVEAWIDTFINERKAS